MTRHAHDPSGYATHKARTSRRQAAQARAGRDIGPMPPIANVRRRRRCERSLCLFCPTYLPETFRWPFSEDQLEVIAAIERSVLGRGLLAFALPRGSGKTALCRAAVLWVVSYALVAYVYLIGATERTAIETLQAIKAWMRDLHPYVDDFPEISLAANHLGGVANRAPGQIWIDGRGGEHSTMIRWETTRIVLPRVPKPPNMRWHRGRLAPTSGLVIGVSGLTGEGIRGALFAHPDGRQVRPTLVLLDDPQTDESARSPQQTHDREQLIAAALLGLAGPGEHIAAIMPCTVIRRDDLADRLLDRKQHPLWRGVRRRMFRTMASDLAAWDRYFEVYDECMGRADPDLEPANSYYREHRAELDAGAEVSWVARKADDEVSAIQHGMNVYRRVGREAFWAEYQNEPLDLAVAIKLLTPAEIAAKTCETPWGQVPDWCTVLTAMLDVHKDLIYWMVAGWSGGFDGAIVAYGTHPDQNRSYFAAADAKPTLAQFAPRAGLEGSIYAGLEAAAGAVLGRDWRRRDGTAMPVERCAIDANWGQSTNAVYLFCGQSRWRSLLLPSHGMVVRASRNPKTFWKRKPEDRAVGLRWAIKRAGSRRSVDYVLYDANFWKTFLHARLKTAMGDKGCLSLARGPDHRLLADHLTGELPSEVTGPYGTIEEWNAIPGRDVHWLDTAVGCAMLASVCRCSLLGEGAAAAPAGKRIVLSQLKRNR